MKKKLSALLLLLCIVLLCSCAKPADMQEAPKEEKVTLSLWAYPTMATQEELQELLDKFTANHPLIKVELTMLEENDQSMVSASIESGSGPDLLLGDLRQLQHARRAGAACVDLTDLLHKDVYNTVTDGCVLADGTLFALPVAMDVTTMAINYEMFEAADALQYIDEEQRTWTTDNFFAAMDAIAEADVSPNGVAIYCGGQNGDVGPRTLISNLHGGSFVTGTRDSYDVHSPAMQQALTALVEHEEVLFDKNLVGSDENLLFINEQLAITLYWDSTRTPPENFTAFPMMYPTSDGNSRLPVEIWGISVHDQGSQTRSEAAQKLLHFFTGTAQNTRVLARTLGHYPVRYMSGFDGDAQLYNDLMAYADVYEQDTPGYAIARTEWYEMLQRIADGGDVVKETLTCNINANVAARQFSK